MHCQYILPLSLLTLLSLTGTLAQTWSVWYRGSDRNSVICASKGSSVVFDCTYSYPATHKVIKKLWFTPRGGKKLDGSQQGDVVYDTSGLNKTRYRGRTEFYDQDKNCTLKLNNVTEDDSGRFFFRFHSKKDNQDPQGFTGPGGVDLNISVLSLKLNENGPVKERDNVTLACTSSCNPPQMEFLWFKDGRPLPGVSGVPGGQYPLGPLSPNDTGCYTCGLGQGTSTSILLDVRCKRKWITAEKKLPTKPVPQIQKATLSTPEDIYENMRQSAKPITDPDDLNYAELKIRPAPSP
ncbi:unnamed protein product, partial [Coregonus sp. 'balchen']